MITRGIATALLQTSVCHTLTQQSEYPAVTQKERTR